MSSTLTTPSVQEYTIDKPPTDGITRVHYGSKHQSTLLGCSSWDKTFRLYDTNKNIQLLNIEHDSALLDFIFNYDTTNVYTCSLDGSMTSIDLTTQHKQVIGSHNNGARCAKYSHEYSMLITGGWDGVIQYYDVRVSNNNSIASHKYSYTHENCKIYTMDCVDSVSGNKPRLVVGLNDRQVYIYDIRKYTQPEQVRESSLINQTRCITCHPSGTGYVLSSIEGRVSVEYFDPSPDMQAHKYAFKCHRQKDNNTGDTLVYPVNTVIYHPIYHTFATGGSDGQINIWDAQNKKRICQYSPYYTSISSMSYNVYGDTMAVAVSYTYDNGQLDNMPNDNIFIRNVNEVEVKPKNR